jgi:PAS domain S-box-containing protein
MLPLAVALPIFFLIFAVMEGWYLMAMVEDGWDGGNGNVWVALEAARHSLWIFTGLGILSGAGWAWIILRPMRRYKAQLDRLALEGTGEPLVVDQQSELSALAESFNRVLQEMGKSLPNRARAVLETISSGVVMLDSSGNIDWANPLACRFFDISPERIKGRSYREVFTWSEGLGQLVTRGLHTGSDFPQETVQITNRFGETRLVGARAAWIRDSDQAPVGLVVTLIDLTRLEAFSSGVRSAERLSSLGQIAAGIAHEVRNPLASIRGLAQLLSESDMATAEKVNSYSKVIVSEVDRVNRVVDRLSMLVAIHDEERTLTPIKKVFDTVAEMASHIARKHKVRIENRLEDETLSAPIRPQRMTQALLNIVINGVEAANEGGLVLLGASRSGNENVVLEVENDGPSISPSEFDDLFHPFHTTKENGTGLGLAITESIVRDHGGRVEVQSGNNRTVFSVILPLEAAS